MKNPLNKLFNSLHSFSSEDDYLIRSINNPAIYKRFNIIGLFVIIISIISLVGGTLLMYHILDSGHKYFSYPIGLFFGFVVTLIYLFLLYTISPPILIGRSLNTNKKHLSKEELKENRIAFRDWLTPSIILRISFILIFAFIIFQPFNVWFSKPFIKNELQTYKTLKKAELIVKSDSTLISEEIRLYNELKKSDELGFTDNNSSILKKKVFEDSAFIHDSRQLINTLKFGTAKNDSFEDKLISLIETEIKSDSSFVAKLESTSIDINKSKIEEIKSLLHQKNISHNKILNTLQDTEFYITQIKKSYQKNPLSYFFTLLFSVLFVYPILLKFDVRNIDLGNGVNFYDKKLQFERDFVLNEFENFKHRFHEILNLSKRQNKLSIINNVSPFIQKLKKIGLHIEANNYLNKIEERFNKKITRFEKYSDPPFNTIIDIETKRFQDADDLIDEVWK